MRLRVLPLPEQRLGEAVETPYLLVIDRCNEDQATHFRQATENVAEKVGARGILVFPGEVALDTEPVPLPLSEVYRKAVAKTGEAANEMLADRLALAEEG